MAQSARQQAGPKALNTIRLGDKRLQAFLDQMDGPGTDAAGEARRDFVRWPFRHAHIRMQVTQPGAGNMTSIIVACRNLSRGGMSVLHSAYMYPGSRCMVEIPHLILGPTVIEGEVVRCAHVKGLVHEIGIRFTEMISPRDYVSSDALSNMFTLEKVNEADLAGCIVCIDDSELDQNIVAHHLRNTKIQVRQVREADGALAAIAEGCDLILCDLNLGEASGVDVVRQIRSAGYRTPVIMISSDTSEATKQKLEALEINAFVSKPITRGTLLRAVAEFLMHEPGQGQARSTLAEDDPAAELIPMFIQSLEGWVRDLRAAMEGGDTQRCRSVCMQIVGSAPTLGFASLADLAGLAGEQLAASMSVEESVAELSVLIAACQGVEP